MENRTVSFIKKHKIIAIIRGVYGNELHDLVQALYKGGVRLVEETFDQADKDCLTKTPEAVRMMKADFPKMKIGTGTTLTIKQLEAAYEAGAEFIISPNTNPTVIKNTKKLGLVSIPGAFTATEILNAHECGADLVKLFPARFMGPAYIKDLIAPLNNIDFIITAGITPDNIKDFFDIGVKGAGISSYLSSRKLLDAKDFKTIEEHAKILTEIADSYN